MVGTALLSATSKHEFITFPKWQFNIGNFEQVLNIKEEFDFIVHLACETDHEYCEANPSNCYMINTIATGNLARLAHDRKVPLLYLSTASIFDGKKGKPYRIENEPNPINHYNASKMYGEDLVWNYDTNYIFRAGWMFGGGIDIDKKFVQKLYRKIACGQRDIKVCDDCIGSPTYTNDLASLIIKAVDGDIERGCYHAVNPSEGVSRYEFACKIVEYLNIECNIIPCKIDDLKDEFPCKRTNYEVLKTSFPLIRSWDEALKEYINDNYKHL